MGLLRKLCKLRSATSPPPPAGVMLRTLRCLHPRVLRGVCADPLRALAVFSFGQAGLGAVPAFRVPEYELQSVFELPLVVLLGALCGLAAAAFKASSQVRAHQNRLHSDLRAWLVRSAYTRMVASCSLPIAAHGQVH